MLHISDKCFPLFLIRYLSHELQLCAQEKFLKGKKPTKRLWKMLIMGNSVCSFNFIHTPINLGRWWSGSEFFARMRNQPTEKWSILLRRQRRIRLGLISLISPEKIEWNRLFAMRCKWARLSIQYFCNFVKQWNLALI